MFFIVEFHSNGVCYLEVSFMLLQVGRKALLLLGGLGMILSMTGAATVLLVFRVEEEEGGGSVAGYVTVTLICFFVFNFAYGWGYV